MNPKESGRERKSEACEMILEFKKMILFCCGCTTHLVNNDLLPFMIGFSLLTIFIYSSLALYTIMDEKSSSYLFYFDLKKMKTIFRRDWRQLANSWSSRARLFIVCFYCILCLPIWLSLSLSLSLSFANTFCSAFIISVLVHAYSTHTEGLNHHYYHTSVTQIGSRHADYPSKLAERYRYFTCNFIRLRKTMKSRLIRINNRWKNCTLLSFATQWIEWNLVSCVYHRSCRYT